MLTITGTEDLRGRVGQELGVSGWQTIDQAAIDRFAEATGDFQFIHVDPEKAAATPFGGTIAHGLLTLSLGPKLSYEIYALEGFAFAVNYGYGKVRFPAPVPVGSRLRMRATLAAVDEVSGGLQLTIAQAFEVDGGDKPVCVAESLVRVYGGA
jgi:acyl dehydratase